MEPSPRQESLTFLFSDVERSTRNWLVRSIEMTNHIPTINGVIERCCGANHGTIFGREGDGRAAHFENPDDAVRAAINIQRSLGDAAVSGGLRVRIGLHGGLVYRLYDGELGGTPLNVIGRMHRAGHGGQIIATRTTLDQAVDALASNPILDLGSWNFRDFEPMQLFQIDWNRESFPPLRSQRQFEPPRPLSTPFFGRSVELTNLETLPSDVVSTITGPGGIGKTRLVRELAARHGHKYRDGVAFIDLQRVTDDGQVVPAIAAQLGIETAQAETEQIGLSHALTGSQVLLILDNCEHVLPSAGEAAQALAETDGPTVLATSRLPMGCRAEMVFPLGPLIDMAAEPTLPASELFAWAAAERRPEFTIDPPTQAQIEAICYRVGNMPLAIELAASRMSSMGIVDLLRLIETNPAGLETGSTPSLQSTLEWSIAHLDPIARDVGVVLAHTVPSAALSELIASVDHSTDAIVRAIDELIGSGLAQLTTPGGQARYQMLQPMRPLFPAADTHATRRLADAYASLAQEIGSEITSDREAGAVSRLTDDSGNVAASVLHDADAGNVGRAARTLIATHMYFFLRMHYEYYNWVDRVLTEGHGLEPPLRAELLGIASFRAIAVGDMERAAVCAAQADELVDATRDRPVNARVTMMTVYGLQGDFVRANGEYGEGIERCSERNDLYARSNLHVMASMGLNSQGLHHMAVNFAESALRDAEEIANPSSVSWSLCALGDAIGAGDAGQSFKLLESAVELSRSVSNRWVEGQALLNLTRAARNTGQLDRARDLCIDALALCQQQANLVRSRQGIREAFLILDGLGRTEATNRLEPLVRALDATVPAAPPDQDRIRNALGDAPRRRAFESGYQPPPRNELEAVVVARAELMAGDS